MIEIAGYIPDIGEKIEYKTLKFEENTKKIEIQVPDLTNEQMDKVIEKVKKSSADILKSFSVTEIVSLIDQVINQLLDRTNPYRQKAEKILPLVTGYHPEIVRLGLNSYLKAFRRHELQRFLVEDFGNPLLLDDFQPRPKRGLSKAVGPALAFHVWAGNVPGLPLWSLISGLLVKSGNIGKVSSSEPLVAGWFAQMLVEIEPRLADCLAIVWWKGGDEERERLLFRQADVVMGYGSNSALESIQGRIPVTTRFLPFGHKISFGVVSNSALDSRKSWKTAHQCALDIVRYDQQGCYSPHIFYVQKGGRVSPKEFSNYIAHELECFEQRYPLRTLSIDEAANVAGWRQQEEMTSYSQTGKTVMGKTRKWTVVFEESGGEFTPSCLNRVIKVIEINELNEIIEQISPHRSYLQTAGVAASPEELFQLAGELGAVGVTRITGIGHMTSPEAGWHHDGRFNLLDLITMVDIERSAEEDAEQYAPYVD